MGIFSYVKRKFEEYMERQKRERSLRTQAQQQFPAFVESSVPLTPGHLRDNRSAVFRTAWKRAVVPKYIYEQKGLADEAALHEKFQRLAINALQASRENKGRRWVLQLGPSERSRVQAKEMQRLFPTPAQVESQQEKRKKPTAVRQRRRSPTRSRKTPDSTINGYEIQNDGTAIDTFLQRFREYLANDRIVLRVSGLASPPRRFSRPDGWISVCAPSGEATGETRWTKKYKVGILLPANYWGLQELVQRTKTIEPYASTNYYETYLRPIAEKIASRVRNFVSQFDPSFQVSAGIKSNGKVSAWILVELRITAYNAVVHCGTHLTDYPRKFLTELAGVVEEELVQDPALMLSIYGDMGFRYDFFRRAEQTLRKKHNVPLIGEGYVSEMSLYRLIRKHCPDAKHEHGPPWLGKQRFDVYLPSLRIAIEYNGPQHYQPIELFGGAEGFEEIKARDERKRKLALENGVTVYEWSYTKPVTEEEVRRVLESFQKMNT